MTAPLSTRLTRDGKWAWHGGGERPEREPWQGDKTSSFAAERRLIGALCLLGTPTLKTFGLSSSDFDTWHRPIWEAAERLAATGQKITVANLYEELPDVDACAFGGARDGERDHAFWYLLKCAGEAGRDAEDFLNDAKSVLRNAGRSGRVSEHEFAARWSALLRSAV